MDNYLIFNVEGNSMSPTLKHGDKIKIKKIDINDKINLNDIVIFNHPFKENFKLIKRVKKIKNEFNLFVEGDNEDILSSEDSHNFGFIDKNEIIGIKKGKI
tara:strand:+ start:1264 stop:1566 length:303 start_codon:yes stop_codon:yes gene_type:complete